MKTKVVSGLFWKFLERGGTQGMHFIISLILARLLMPKDYGAIAIITVFITISNVFIQVGFSTALIRNKKVDDLDYSSAFYVSLMLAGIIYIGLFIGAPFIASFYDTPVLKPAMRVLSLSLLFGSVNCIQNAVITRDMQFKKLFYRSLSAIIISGAMGIAAAYFGLGLWALVIQQLSFSIVVVIVMWFTVSWRPKLMFSWQRVRLLLSVGWKLLVGSLIGTVYNEVESLVVGKLFKTDSLGFMNRGKTFPKIGCTTIDGAMQSVMLPAYAKYQDDRARVKGMVRKSMMTSAFLLFPTMTGLAVVAEPLVRLVLTDKWLPCVPFLQIYCLVYVLFPLHTANLQAINALGRTDITLKLEIIKKIIAITILVATCFISAQAIAWGYAAVSLLSTAINAFPNKKLLDYGFIEQLKDLASAAGASAAMGVPVYIIGELLPLPAIATLLIQIALGVAIYVIIAVKFKMQGMTFILQTFKEMKQKQKNKEA